MARFLSRLAGDNKLWFLSSAAIVGLAALAQLGPGIADYLWPVTHCYRSVTTLSESVPAANCFTVSRSGTFGRVFQADPESSIFKTAHPGHVIPGLWDGHGHLLQYGEFLGSVNLFGSHSFDDVRSRIGTYLDENPGMGTKQEWLRGVGWDQMAFGRMPAASDLAADKRFDGLYVMLDRVDVHCIWVSQAVLDLLQGDIPDIPGGEVVREPGLGVFCDNAMDMVMELWPKPTREQKKKSISRAMASLNRLGLVGMHDAGVTPGNLELYKSLSETPDWTVRVYAMIECDDRNTFCGNAVERYKSSTGSLSIQSVKLFADGALGSWGSAMIDPYSDRPDTSGSLLVNASTLTSVASAWAADGFQVNIHAIGDLANRYAVDAMSTALKLVCPGVSLPECQSDRRFRIEHAQIIHPSDQERIRSIGIIASIQPTHATSDMAYAEKRLGHDRITQEAYRMRSLLGSNCLLGSDFPVEPADPFQGMYAAVTRKSPHTGRGAGDSDDGWHMEEALTIEEALKGFTLSPAYGAFLEAEAGVIQPGFYADWVVLDAPIDEIDVEELRSFHVRETWVAGKRVYRRE